MDDDSLLKRLMADDPALPKARPCMRASRPQVCVHGTYKRCKESIERCVNGKCFGSAFRQGLIAGGGVSQRNHVHFAPYEPRDGRVISGMRCLAKASRV